MDGMAAESDIIAVKMRGDNRRGVSVGYVHHVERDATYDFIFTIRRDFLSSIPFIPVTMFKPSTRHNIQPGHGHGAGPSSYSEVRLNKRQSTAGQPSGRYQYRLNL
jgi:hypothetical protein